MGGIHWIHSCHRLNQNPLLDPEVCKWTPLTELGWCPYPNYMHHPNYICIIFHQLRFPWKKGVPFPFQKTCLLESQIGRVWSRSKFDRKWVDAIFPEGFPGAYSLDVIKPSWAGPRGKRVPKGSCTWQEGKNLEDHPTMGTHSSFIFRGYKL